MDKARELAEAHWKYTGNLIEYFTSNSADLELYKFLYIEAFIHGYKHGVEDTKRIKELTPADDAPLFKDWHKDRLFKDGISLCDLSI